jgi:hypothetical protein
MSSNKQTEICVDALDEIRGEVTTVEESTLIEAIVLFFSANLLLSLTTFDHLKLSQRRLLRLRARRALANAPYLVKWFRRGPG